MLKGEHWPHLGDETDHHGSVQPIHPTKPLTFQNGLRSDRSRITLDLRRWVVSFFNVRPEFWEEFRVHGGMLYISSENIG